MNEVNELQTSSTAIELQYPSKWMLELDLLLLQQTIDSYKQIIEDNPDHPDWQQDAEAELLNCEMAMSRLTRFRESEAFQGLPE